MKTRTFRPPVQQSQGEIQAGARRLERLLARRRQLVKTLRGLEDQIRTARRLLRDLIADVTTGVEATPDDGPTSDL